MNSIGNQNIKGPTTERERYVILDALRGICAMDLSLTGGTSCHANGWC